MKNLFQRNWYTDVSRSDNGMLRAETTYLDTYREAAAQLLVDVNSFIIKEALWTERRSLQTKKVRTRQITALHGAEAYLNSGPALKKAAAFLADSLTVSLFAEAIRGIVQAETFLLEERGYASEEDYDNAWADFYLGSCRYYSNLDRVTQSWYAHVGESKRDGNNLYVRFKTQSLFSLGEGRYLLTGNFSDSFHEISISIKLDKFTVEHASGVLPRTPDLVCKEAAQLLDNLQGINLHGLPKKEIATILGNGQGCIHLIDLVSDCAQLLELYQFT
ncbi:MAG: DUF2889 domain-containing protein [Desulfosporosinus sp.]|jgi:hypothetical protein